MKLPEQDLGAWSEPDAESLWNQYCTGLTELEGQQEGWALPGIPGAQFLSGLALGPWESPGLFWASVSCAEAGGYSLQATCLPWMDLLSEYPAE